MTDKNEVLRLARLAKLELSESETETAVRDMEKIIEFASEINRAADIDISGVSPCALSELGDGAVKPSKEREKILSCAESENGFFKVKGGI